ncbi:Imm1 family immunity protein [Streptomyces hokutonensis]|uniref:Imm1 family immunity protein n=1 Tax=Streptomyces hokutonensis TaxID=1306990 RepID=UPI0033D6319C
MRGIKAVFRDEHIESPALLDSPESIDALIDALMAGPPTHNTAQLFSLDRPLLPSGYPDHLLVVGVDKDAEIGMLSLLDDGNFVPRGSVDRGVVLYHLLGHPREFMAGSEISIDLIRQSLKEFLSSGGKRSTCIEWQEERFA